MKLAYSIIYFLQSFFTSLVKDFILFCVTERN